MFALNDRYIGAQLFLRCWPFVNGQGRLVDRLFSRLSFDQKLETVLTTDGFTMTVDPNDLIGRHIYLTGKFDRTVFGVLSKFARPGDTLLDIGANIGYVCGCFLQNVPQSKVIAVEPQPIIVNQLTSNLPAVRRRPLFCISSGVVGFGWKSQFLHFAEQQGRKSPGHGTGLITMRGGRFIRSKFCQGE